MFRKTGWLIVLMLMLADCGGGSGGGNPAADTTAPEITLIGASSLSIAVGVAYVEPGATAQDNVDGDISARIATDNSAVNTAVPGTYTVTYNVSDTAGNAAAQVVRTVVVLISSPVVTLGISGKQLDFSWGAVNGADHYRILENPDGASGFSVEPTASHIVGTSHSLSISVYRTDWVNAQYQVEACNADDSICVSSTQQTLTLIDAITATIYVKASNSGANDLFGQSVALSSDGNTLAVGAYGEGSAATGINGNQADNSASFSGAVYVFTHTTGTWSQQAYIKASNSEANDWFGYSVALSSDGNTLAVGAFEEDSAATGINGNQVDNSATDSGAVYVFTRTAGIWNQQAYVKASNTDANDGFGLFISLSSDGNTLAVPSYMEGSAATGINGNQADNTAPVAGAVYVFTRTAGTWAQQAYVKASNTDANDRFGQSVALSSDGNTLAVGGYLEGSAATGVNGNQADNTANQAGAVYVFTRTAGAWSQQAYVKASNTDANDLFGQSVALSSDGNTLAVGGYLEGSAATGVNGNQADNTANQAGAVYVFTRTAGAWAQQAYVKASNTDANDWFGTSVALSSDGNTLAVVANFEDSAATGINGNQADNSAPVAGAVYVFTRTAGTWAQQAYVKASNTEAGDTFGRSVALNSDGNTLAVGAAGEGSAATGLGGNQTSNTAAGAGAVYVY